MITPKKMFLFCWKTFLNLKAAVLVAIHTGQTAIECTHTGTYIGATALSYPPLGLGLGSRVTYS